MRAIVKLALLLSINILAFSLDNTYLLLALTLISLGFWISSRPDPGKVKFTLFLIIPTIWYFTIMQGMFYQEYPRTVILVIIPPNTPILGWITGGVYLYYEGLLYGLKQSMRAISIMLYGLYLAWTTSEKELLEAVLTFIRHRGFAIMTITAIKFISMLHQDLRMALTAVKANRLSKRLILRPILAQALRHSYTLSMTLYTRGLDVKGLQRLKYELTTFDKVLIITALIPSLAIALIKFLTYLFLLDLLYIPQLRLLYWYSMNGFI